MKSEIALFLDQPDLAERYLDEAERIDTDDYLVLRAKWSSTFLALEFENYTETVTRALELFPEDPDVLYAMVNCFAVQGNQTSLDDFIENSAAWFRATAQFHAAVGRAAKIRHDVSSCEAAYRHAVAMQPNNATYWAFLAETLFTKGEWAESERDARFALESNPKNSSALQVLAKLAERNGNQKLAEHLNQQAAEAVPALRNTGLRMKAMAAVRKASLMKPSNY